jgi:hypothetical protein
LLEIYRQAWERTLALGDDDQAARDVLGTAFLAMTDLVERAERDAVLGVGLPGEFASELASFGARIEAVMERLSRIESALASPRDRGPVMALASAPGVTLFTLVDEDRTRRLKKQRHR